MPDQFATPQQQQQNAGHVPSCTVSQHSLAHPAIAIVSTGQQMPQQQQAQQQQQESALPMSLTSVTKEQKPQGGSLLKKKPPTMVLVALGILHVLEPPCGSDNGHSQSGHGLKLEEYLGGLDSGHGLLLEKKEKHSFWGGSKDKDREQEQEQAQEREREWDREMYTLCKQEFLHWERVPDEGPAELTHMISASTSSVLILYALSFI